MNKNKDFNFGRAIALVLLGMFIIILSLTFICSADLSRINLPIDNKLSLIPAQPIQDRAGSYTFDNKKDFIKTDNMSYGKVSISNSFLGLFETGKIEDIELIDNTNSCWTSCSAEKEIKTYVDTKLIDSVRFVDLKTKQDVNLDYKFYLRTSHEPYNVSNYKVQCSGIGIFNETGEVQSCSNVQTGTHQEYSDKWQEYNNEVLPAGNYYLKLVGEKSPSQNIDWIIKSQNKEIFEWANWNSTLNNKLIHYWNMSLLSSTMITNQVNSSANGTLIGNVSSLIGGIIENATNYSNNALTPLITYVNTTAYLPTGDVPMSVSLWFKTPDNQTAERIITAGQPYTSPMQRFYIDTPGNTGTWGVSGQGLAGGKIANNTWYHLVFTYNGTGFNFYINGTVIDKITQAQEINKTGQILLGSSNDGGGNAFQGMIDEIAIWNRTLSQSEVTQLYNNGNGISFDGNALPVDNSIVENSQTFNSIVYEQSIESYSINITYFNQSYYPNINGTFWYNGSSYIAIKTIVGNNTIFSYSQSISSSLIGNRNFKWIINANSTYQYNSSENIQNVSAIQLALCNSNLNISYLNLTFKNETSIGEGISAAISSSTFTYWTTNQNINKTLSFANVTENKNYSFCFAPSNIAINLAASINYYNSESPQRTFTLDSVSLSNVSSVYILYLLPSSAGLYTHYKTITFSNSILPGVFAQVYKTGTNNLIASGYTDSSGQIVFWLNPNNLYDYVFSKSGFTTSTFTIAPSSSDTYTVTMGSPTNTVNGSTIANNLTSDIQPGNLTLLNNTQYTFSFNVAGNGINFISMNITNLSGYQLSYQSINGRGIISDVINTQNYTQLLGTFFINTSTESLTITRVWTIGNFYSGDYSLYNQMRLFSGQYGYENWILIFVSMVIITLIMIGLSYAEVVDTTENTVAVVTLLVWAFSIVGWMNTGISNSNPLAASANQFGIAIIVTAIAVYIWIRRLG